jgi:hypothetical protein
MEGLQTPTAFPLLSKAAIGSHCHGSLMDSDRPSTLGEPFVATQSEWNSWHELLCRPIQEHLSIHIFPAVQTTPTHLGSPRLAGAQQFHIGFDHHAVTAATPVPLLNHEHLSPHALISCKTVGLERSQPFRLVRDGESNPHAIPRKGTQDEIMEQVGL